MVYKMLRLFLMSVTLKMHKMFCTFKILCNLATMPEMMMFSCQLSTDCAHTPINILLDV